MSRYIVQNRINEPVALKDFNVDGYRFVKKLSNDNVFVFTRKKV